MQMISATVSTPIWKPRQTDELLGGLACSQCSSYLRHASGSLSSWFAGSTHRGIRSRYIRDPVSFCAVQMPPDRSLRFMVGRLWQWVPASLARPPIQRLLGMWLAWRYIHQGRRINREIDASRSLYSFSTFVSRRLFSNWQSRCCVAQE